MLSMCGAVVGRAVGGAAKVEVLMPAPGPSTPAPLPLITIPVVVLAASPVWMYGGAATEAKRTAVLEA